MREKDWEGDFILRVASILVVEAKYINFHIVLYVCLVYINLHEYKRINQNTKQQL